MARPDFPRTLAEFQDRFASEEDCRRYLVACRWPDGFRCPRCGEPDAYELAGREAPAVPGVPAPDLGDGGHGPAPDASCPSGSGSRRPTWSPPTRRASRRPSSSASSASPGTRPPGRCCTSSGARCLPARSGTASRAWSRSTRRTWAASRRGAAAGGSATAASPSSWGSAAAARAASGSRWCEDLAAASLVPFVEASVEPGSTVLTDGWQGYAPLRKGYDHRPSTVGNPRNASELFPRVHRTFSNLKTWLQGSHHGVEREAPAVLRRRVRVPGSTADTRRWRRSSRCWASGAGTPPTTHKMLYAAEPTG